MESFLPSEIARLVLGYLEDHKCEEAYEAFLKTSANLIECLKMREEGRKFRTQVLGLNLLDILYEYSAIYSLVQEKLKKVDPETASSLKHSGSLLDKITFLLNATSSGQTMLFSITLPPGKSPSTAHVRKRLRSTTINDKKKELRKHSRMNIEDFSPIVEVEEPVTNPSTLETTSLSSLPGNANIILDRTVTSEGNDIIRTPKRKPYSMNSSRRARTNSEIPEESEENLDITALTKALLDNHELHEKIAENINKVIRTPDLTTGANVSQSQDLCSAQTLTLSDATFSNNFTLELDNAIKKIVEDTESDPLFENFLQEVVCPPDETSDDCEDKGISDTSTPCQSTPETVKKTTSKRLRSVKKRTDSPITSSTESPTKIEHQNAAAIESIISMQAKAKENEFKKQELVPIVSQTSVVNTQPIIVPATVSQKVPPTVIYSEPVEYPPMTDNRVVILSSKLTNTGSQILTVQPGSFKNPTYTEDILRMPTVIINDEQNPSNTLIVPTKVFPLGNGPPPLIFKNPPLLLPHPTINTNVTTIPTETITYTVNVQPVSQPTTTTLQSSSNQAEENAPRSVPIISTSSGKKQKKNEQLKTTTPSQDTNPKQLRSLSTPRGGRSSHIRALDFSTPTKENFPKKSLTSPKTRVLKKGKTPKKSKFNLFTSPLNMPIATRSPREKLQGDWAGTELLFEPEKPCDTETKLDTSSEEKSRSKPKNYSSWDQDLRMLVQPVQQQTKKKKLGKKRTKSTANKTEEQVEEKLSKTEEDGKTIEAELEKPVKKKWARKKKSDESKPKTVRRRRQAKPKPKPADKSEVKEELIEVNTEELIIKEEMTEENIQQSKEIIKETVEEHQNKETNEVIKIKETKEDNQNKPTTEQQPPKSRLKRKCNVGSSTKKTNNNLEDKQKSPTESTSEETRSLTVLSPSKMKAKKRIFVEQDKPEATEDRKKTSVEPTTSSEPEIILSPSKMKVKKRILVEQDKPDANNDTKKLSVEPSVSNKPDNNIITPDMAKLFDSNVIKAKKNITPMLETPFKDETSLLPITPRILTPLNVDASFSSLIKQNCGNVDLSSIMTPNFPMTPSFPLTPHLPTGDSQSSYASRPTDYSNSSSYYQPSDSEQNQKLEQVLIEEAMKLESASLKRQIWTSTPDKEHNNKELSVPPTDTMPNSAGEKTMSNEPVIQKLNSSLEMTKASVKSFEDDYNISSSSSDQSKENLQIEKESNETVIHVTPGQLKRGGKHLAMLKNLLQPVDLNSESDVSESPESEGKTSRRNSKQEENCETENKTIKMEEIIQVKEENPEPPEEDKNTETENKLGKKKSKTTKVHNTLLEELEMKRKRIVAELNTESNKTTERKRRGPQKGVRRVRKKLLPDPTRITRARVTAKKKEAEAIEKLDLEKQKPTKQATPKKNTSIEDVAARLKKEQNEIQNPPKEKGEPVTKCPIFSPNTSIDSQDDNFSKGKYIPMSTEDEDVPRLHLSSDEETPEDECDIVKGLKERGIHLIPKKPLDKKTKETLKDEDNPTVINSQKLDLTVAEEGSTVKNESFDPEDNVPLSRIEKKIEIKSDIYLKEDNKIDVSKVLSQSICMETIIRSDKTRMKSVINKCQNSNDAILQKSEVKEQNTEKTIETQKADNKKEQTNEKEDTNSIDFDLKVITENSSEHIKIVHDESKVITKTIADYNLEVLNKKITAKVFSEELNTEQDRTMTVTPFIEVISFSEKNILKPLEILYNEIDDESTVDTLFDESPNSKIDTIIKKQTDLEKSIRKEKLKLQLSRKSDVETVFGADPVSPKPKKKISLAQYKNKQTKKTQEVEEVVNTKDKSLELNSEEDDLMTFAVTGTEKDKEAPVQDSISGKRKAESDVLQSPIEKRAKTKDNALLKTLNVDEFLSMLHGPSCSKV